VKPTEKQSVLALLVAASLLVTGCPVIFSERLREPDPVAPPDLEPSGTVTYTLTATPWSERGRDDFSLPIELALAESGAYERVGRNDLSQPVFALVDAHVEIGLEVEEDTPALLPLLSVLTLGVVPFWSDASYRARMVVRTAEGSSPEYQAAEEARVVLWLGLMPWFWADMVRSDARGERNPVDHLHRVLIRDLVAQARADGWLR
jgi:hypothetical protein